jgi:hypothetical protein
VIRPEDAKLYPSSLAAEEDVVLVDNFRSGVAPASGDGFDLGAVLQYGFDFDVGWHR